MAQAQNQAAGGGSSGGGSASRSRVCVLYVGGTIGMVKTETGYRPGEGFLEQYMAQMSELRSPEVPAYDIETLEPLLDSADMAPEDWLRIAEAVRERYDRYDGFVVLHGTDTMAYTASALSFLLPGLTKPVVLTGAQLSLQDVRSDGREHIITAMIVAGTLPIPEVCIYFSSVLLRGNRAQKVNSNAFVAFASENLAPLADVGVRIDVHHQAVRPAGEGLRHVALPKRPHVIAIRLFPGMSPVLLAKLLEPPVDGVVLTTYGAGNFPSSNEAMLAPIREATSRDQRVIVVNCSQCAGGSVQPELYSTGSALSAAGVVGGRDMTPEAALTKLYCLLAMGHGAQDVVRMMGEDMAGELEA